MCLPTDELQGKKGNTEEGKCVHIDFSVEAKNNDFSPSWDLVLPKYQMIGRVFFFLSGRGITGALLACTN